MTTAPPSSSAPARGRRTPRASGDDREKAILETAERLLADSPWSKVSVEDLARGAGISRPTFYFYFATKDAVLLTLVDSMVAAANRNREEVEGMILSEPRAAWRRVLQESFDAFGSRRAVTLAAAELRASNAEARELWSQVMESWVSEVAEIVEAERARGAAPPGQPARDLAVALLQMNERAQHASFAAESPSLAEDRVVDVLADVWLRAIYGALPA